MIITTTPTVEGRPVTEYLGIVFGESALGEGIFKAIETTIHEARQKAIGILKQQAKALGANAVVGVSLDLETRGVTHCVLASGTAVVIP